MIKLPKKIVAFDTETTGLWPYQTEHRKKLGLAPDRPFAFSFCNVDGQTDFFRAEVDPWTREVSYDKCRPYINWLKRIASDPEMTVVMHNAPFDRRHTIPLGIEWRCKIMDTAVMAHCADPTEISKQLKYLAKKYLEIPDDDQQALKKDLARGRRIAKAKGWSVADDTTHGKKSNLADYCFCSPELLERYARVDAERTIYLWMMYNEILDDNEDNGGKLWEIYAEEMETQEASIRMEQAGISVRPEAMDELFPIYDGIRAKYLAKVHAEAGPDFKPASPAHVKKLFVTERGYKTTNLTKKGNPSVDGTTLAVWAIEHNDPLAQDILEWKASAKATNEVNNYKFFTCLEDGRHVIHPTWRPTGAKTGRFSCADPNLMQMTNVFSGRKRATIDTRQRECFGPQKGRIWYAIDYGQIEVWIFAFFAKEPEMMRALLAGEDFHTATATKAFGHYKDFTGDPKDEHSGAYKWRRRAKLIFFSRLYGGGVDKLATLINCSRSEAKTFANEFNANLPGVRKYMDRLINQVTREGILINGFGREYPIDTNYAYKAVNWNIQGTAADVMKRAFNRTDAMLRERWDGTWLSATVHDELFVDLPIEYHSMRLINDVTREMQRDSSHLGIPVPLPVDVKIVRRHLLEGRKVA